jgi:hypothetical protein
MEMCCHTLAGGNRSRHCIAILANPPNSYRQRRQGASNLGPIARLRLISRTVDSIFNEHCVANNWAFPVSLSTGNNSPHFWNARRSVQVGFGSGGPPSPGKDRDRLGSRESQRTRTGGPKGTVCAFDQGKFHKTHVCTRRLLPGSNGQMSNSFCFRRATGCPCDFVRNAD